MSREQNKNLMGYYDRIYFRKYAPGPVNMRQIRTKVFTSGNSQAVRLPREFRLDQEEVYIRKKGKSIVITPCPLPGTVSWKTASTCRMIFRLTARRCRKMWNATPYDPVVAGDQCLYCHQE